MSSHSTARRHRAAELLVQRWPGPANAVSPRVLARLLTLCTDCSSGASTTRLSTPFQRCTSRLPRISLLKVVARYSSMPWLDEATLASGAVKTDVETSVG